VFIFLDKQKLSTAVWLAVLFILKNGKQLRRRLRTGSVLFLIRTFIATWCKGLVKSSLSKQKVYSKKSISSTVTSCFEHAFNLVDKEHGW